MEVDSQYPSIGNPLTGTENAADVMPQASLPALDIRKVLAGARRRYQGANKRLTLVVAPNQVGEAIFKRRLLIIEKNLDVPTQQTAATPTNLNENLEERIIASVSATVKAALTEQQPSLFPRAKRNVRRRVSDKVMTLKEEKENDSKEERLDVLVKRDPIVMLFILTVKLVLGEGCSKDCFQHQPR
jgi:hypothetical protein